MSDAMPVCRIVVCGGRLFANVPLLFRTLDEIDKMRNVRPVIDGASDDVTGPYVGADYWGHQWALARGKPFVRQHAEWNRHGRAAGPIRNQVMARMQPDIVVAFKGGNGTADMVRRARQAGIEVIEVA